MDEYAASMPQAPAGPPPGWYNDPGGMPVLRWWDGQQWGPHTQPLPGAPEGTGRHRAPAGPDPEPPAGSAQVSASPVRAPAGWAWIVAVTPVIATVIIIAVGTSASNSAALTAGWIIADIIAVIAAWRDARVLALRGEITATGYAWLSLLGGWPYLLARTIKRTPRGAADWWLFAIGVVLWLAALLLAAPLSGGSTAGSGTCTTASCITADAEGLKGTVAKDNSVMTNVVCSPSTVSQVVSGTYTVNCTVTYSDGSKWAGIASVLTASGNIDWEPTSMISAGSGG